MQPLAFMVTLISTRGGSPVHCQSLHSGPGNHREQLEIKYCHSHFQIGRGSQNIKFTFIQALVYSTINTKSIFPIELL